MGNKEFNAYIQEKLGWYVYALRDPRDKRIFYIGKGKGNRVFAHANKAKIFEGDAASQKIALIKEIHASGNEVETFILRHGISSEASAYITEAALIDLLYLLDPNADNPLFQVTNIVKGHKHQELGSMSTDAIFGLYNVDRCPKIAEPVILFKIPRLWFPQMSQDDLFEATHGWWVLGERREKAEYAFAVSAGVIRGIYKINKWKVRGPGDRGYKRGEKVRYGFDGHLTNELNSYLNKSVKHLYKAGESNPTKYLNC